MMPIIPHQVGQRVVVDNCAPLRAWREYLGLSQAQVADRLGVSQAAYSRLESPQVRPQGITLFRVAAALGIRPTQLDI